MGRLGPLLSLDDHQGNPLPWVQDPAVGPLDSAVVDEDLALVGNRDEAPPLLLIETLYFAFKHFFTY